MTIAEATHIRTDKDTLAKLREKSGGKPISAFLRDLANGVEQVPVPANALELMRESIYEKLEAVSEDLQRIRQSDELTTMIMSGFQQSINELQVAIINLAGKIPGGKEELKQFENLNEIIEEQEYYKTYDPWEGIEGVEVLDAAALKKLQQEYNIPDSVIDEIRKEFEDDESESDEQ